MNLNNLFKNRMLYNRCDSPSLNPLDYVHPWVKPNLEKILIAVPESVEMILVYGSSLGDFMRFDSDLDLAVISNDPAVFNKHFVGSLNLDMDLDVKVFPSLKDLKEQADGFFPTPKAIMDEGLPIYVKGKIIEMR